MDDLVEVYEDRLVANVIDHIRDNVGSEEPGVAEERIQELRDNLNVMDADNDADIPDLDDAQSVASDVEWITDQEGEELPEFRECDWFCQNKNCLLGVTVDEGGAFLHGGHEFFVDPLEEFETGTIVDFTWNTFTPFKPNIPDVDYNKVVDMIADDTWFDKVITFSIDFIVNVFYL